MKKAFLCVVSLCLCAVAIGQQKPHYTQYILNQYIVNPAITGIENYMDVKISHRHQWAGFQDAPVTTYMTIHAPLGKKDFRTTATSHDVEGSNPRGESYWEDYSAAAPHHGLGVQVMNDRTGPLNRLSAQLTYAYHLGLSPRTSLSAGFGVGFNKISLDASKLDFDVQVDPAVNSSGILNKIRPDISAGLYLYSSDFFVGVSAQQVVPQKVEFRESTVTPAQNKLVPHLFATTGYRFLLGQDLNFIPSVMVKYMNPVPVQFELNGKLQYRDLAWVGASYRKEDGVAAMVGLNVSSSFNVGYSYDYTTSNLNRYSRGTHEILVGFMLGNKFGDTCPRNVW